MGDPWGGLVAICVLYSLPCLVTILPVESSKQTILTIIVGIMRTDAAFVSLEQMLLWGIPRGRHQDTRMSCLVSSCLHEMQGCGGDTILCSKHVHTRVRQTHDREYYPAHKLYKMQSHSGMQGYMAQPKCTDSSSCASSVDGYVDCHGAPCPRPDA